MLIADVDWTTIALASIGLAGSIVSAIVMVRVKRIELQAAENARIAARAAQRSEDSAARYQLPKKKRKKPPEHGCG